MALDQPDSKAKRSFTLPVWLAASAATGVAAGVIAQLLTVADSATQPLGGSTAPWVAIGFSITLAVVRRWTGQDRLLWACIVAAVYLYSWLLAYHLLYGVIQGPPAAAVWAESRLWVAAVAPACAALGLLAVGSLRPSVVGDVCLAAPLAWSLPEAVRAAHSGWHQVLLFTLPALVLAMIPLATEHGRRWNPTVVTLAALLGGAAFTFVLPPVLQVLNSAG